MRETVIVSAVGRRGVSPRSLRFRSSPWSTLKRRDAASTEGVRASLGLLAGWVLWAGLGQCLAAEGLAKESTGPRTFYVDSETGQDAADGRSAEHAWRSLEQVNSAALKPGDTVRFKCGGLWRGSLVPASGDERAPVTYTSFGQGPKPRFFGSVPRNRPEDWVKIKENLWATLPVEYRQGPTVLNLKAGAWSRHQEAGAQIDLTRMTDSEGMYLRIACRQSGSASNHVQLWGPELKVKKGDYLLLAFRARSSKPFRFPGFSVLGGRSPWKRIARSGPAERSCGPDWDSYQVASAPVSVSETGRLHIGLGGLLAAGTVFDFQPLALHTATPNVTDPLTVDVGNLIFDEGKVCGWKKWSVDALSKPYDYYYDRPSQRVYLCLEQAPTSRHRSIELALARHVVNQSGAHHVVYDGLAVMYGAAHGFGGGATHHLVIRNCDLGYIGGAHQFTRPDGKPVRFGNAIEFWGAAHDHLVEGCHVWEVYDAALTNQGRGPDSKQINITYRNNIIRNSEYSFEYWNNPETAVTENIRFVHNTCINAGGGWAHAQRPDRNGSHLMFYSNTAATSGIEVKYNIFCGATEWGSRYTGGWRVLPEMDYNLWYSTTGVTAYWFRQKIAGFDEYRRTTGLDAHSQFAEPKFVGAPEGDYRLAPTSPGRRLRPDGGAVGAEGGEGGGRKGEGGEIRSRD